jgi:hypothetical protein
MHAAACNLDSELLGAVPPDQPAATPTIRRLVDQHADYFPPHAEWDEISGAWIENDALRILLPVQFHDREHKQVMLAPTAPTSPRTLSK